MNEKIRLLIVDDHRVVREGLKAFITPISDLEIVGEAQNGQEAVALESQLKPDLILMDLVMPGMDGIEAIRAIRKQRPCARILVLTSFIENEKVLAAVKAGAAGYLLKDSSPEELHAAIHTIYLGESSLSPEAARIVMTSICCPDQDEPELSMLTTREREILCLVAEGLSNDQIANRLVLSAWTVRSHIGRILNKLQVENRTQAALLALRAGLADLRS